MSYGEFFEQATTYEPYLYQQTIAENDQLPALLRVWTGAGKTESVVLGWLYRLFMHSSSAVRHDTPRRLVYCLPMRTLVEQTVERAGRWLEALGMSDQVALVTLMGGQPDTEWYLDPERPTIIVGTQDMLISRALNRGYGMDPARWPIDYGLLNNDCLWILDEVQLMSNGLPTSTQLAGIRSKLGTYGPVGSLWMSATARADWLNTIDHDAPTVQQVVELSADDLASPGLSRRYNATKLVCEASGLAGLTGRDYRTGMAQLIAQAHRAGTLTLVVVNTVGRAQEVYNELNNPRNVLIDAETVLVHSRFRPVDRAAKNAVIASYVDPDGAGQIVVATQAVEAGVDISARTLITELAPWASLVQRFGRCNRAGEFEEGSVIWIDTGKQSPNIAPYDPEDVKPARERMRSLEGASVGPANIEALGDAMESIEHLTVIRRRDVIGLFDTTADLSGSYLDVSNYVRGTDERDVSVFWRTLTGGQPQSEDPRPSQAEIVSAPIGGSRGRPKGIRDYLGADDRRAWTWDPLDNEWRQIQPWQISPGMTLLLAAGSGGYSSETGWDVSHKGPVTPVADPLATPEDGHSTDISSTSQRRWVELSAHSLNVESEARKTLDNLSSVVTDPDDRSAVLVAARYHDAGKAHHVFQNTLRKLNAGKSGSEIPGPDTVLAKSAGGHATHERRHFRHELGSALVVLSHAHALTSRSRALAAYLAAAHHGKVRLGIRSLPGRRRGIIDSNPDPSYLLGYRTSDYEILPTLDLGDGLHVPETELDMSIAQMGVLPGGVISWMDGTLELLERLGPFKLAYLEAIVRAADMRASRDEQLVPKCEARREVSE